MNKITGRKRSKPGIVSEDHLPAITLVVAAYNEAAIIQDKIDNALRLEYPADKLEFIFITDGSADDTPAIISRYPRLRLLHEPTRKGKAAALNRAMEYVQTELVVFSDANTFINKDALIEIAPHFRNPVVGAVAGEKRVTGRGGAVKGESIYWKMESKLKAWESDFHSVMGAAGELFAIRTDLFRPVPQDSLVDDMEISLRVMEAGYLVSYEGSAYANENPSLNTSEERKRKLRLAAGALQIFTGHLRLMVPTRPLITFQYLSHRVLRWMIAPWLLLLAFACNCVLIFRGDANWLIAVAFLCQASWYLLAIMGWVLDKSERRAGLLFVPYYFCLMNYCMIAGMIRYLKGQQTVYWEKAERDC